MPRVAATQNLIVRGPVGTHILVDTQFQQKISKISAVTARKLNEGARSKSPRSDKWSGVGVAGRGLGGRVVGLPLFGGRIIRTLTGFRVSYSLNF